MADFPSGEFQNVWITHDRRTLAWEHEDGSIFVLQSGESYAVEVEAITDLETGWIQLGGGRG
jgi:hypothetical protein